MDQRSWRVGGVESDRVCISKQRPQAASRTQPYVTAVLPLWHLPAVDKHLKGSQNLPLQQLTTETLLIDCTVTFGPPFRMCFISTDILLLGYYSILSENVSKYVGCGKKIIVAKCLILRWNRLTLSKNYLLRILNSKSLPQPPNPKGIIHKIIF